MSKLLHPEALSALHMFYYRFRFLGIYIVIGFLSLMLELGIRLQLLWIGLPTTLATIVSLAMGIVFAFIGNAWFNFRIPPLRRDRAFVYFAVISLLSGGLQWLISKTIITLDWDYEQGRLVISGSLFMFAYLLHRKYSFRDFKRVGVAIYANGVENIEDIHKRVGQYPDFIHVDIVDQTFVPDADETKVYRMEAIRAFWPNLEIHTHLMSKTPSQWLPEVIPYSDIIYLHSECDENIPDLLKEIRFHGKQAGIALTMKTSPDKVQSILEKADAVLLLTIPEPGRSGQMFDMGGLERIEELKDMSCRKELRVCVDGGVNEKIAPLLQVEDIVSGSAVLNHQHPKYQILRLQTAGRYEAL